MKNKQEKKQKGQVQEVPPSVAQRVIRAKEQEAFYNNNVIKTAELRRVHDFFKDEKE